MVTGQMKKVIRRLRESVRLRDTSGTTDGQLLERFIARREEAAFEALVERHGPMVLGVCRRVVGHADDAEDAFQATFLVLVRKADSVMPREAVGNWLYGVAYRTALEARARATRRRAREKQVKDMPHPVTERKGDWQELQSILDRELSRLPDKYRVPVVLCELERRSRKQVAQQLHLPEGTLSSRLAMARKMLARRMARHGLVLSAGALALILSQNTASASVPTVLVGSTVKAATSIAAGKAATAGVVSANVAALTEGVLKAMFMTKLKIATVVVLALGLIATGAGIVVTYTSAAEGDANRQNVQLRGDVGPAAQKPAQKDDGQQNDKDNAQQNDKDDGQKNQKDAGQANQKDDGQKNQKDDGQQNQNDGGNQGVIKKVDLVNYTITLTFERFGRTLEQTIPVALNAQVELAKKPTPKAGPLEQVLTGGATNKPAPHAEKPSGDKPRTVAGKVNKLPDVKPGMRVTLKLTQDRSTIVGIKELINLQNKGDGQNNQKDDGDQNQKDDGQKNQKDDGQANQKDDAQKNQKEDGEQKPKDAPPNGGK